MLSARSQPSPPGGKADLVKDVGLAGFLADVIEASKQRPVIVDFWAEWCGPCKQLTPLLEKLVRAAKGAVHLAKIDIDKNPQIAQQMGIQSIPAVFAFFRGQPIDGFMGALPEAQIKTWIDRLLEAAGSGKPAGDQVLEEILKRAGELLAAKDYAAAQAIYGDILDGDPFNVPALAGMMRSLIGLGQTKQAAEMLRQTSPEIVRDKAFDPVRAAIELAEQAAGKDDIAGLEAKLQQNPADHQARFDLALAFYAAGKREEAVDHLLEIVRRSRNWNEDAARKQLVKFFEAFGPADPLTISARKRLSSILFA